MEGDIPAKASPARTHSSNNKARLPQRASEVPLAPGHHQRHHYPSRIHPAKPQPQPQPSHSHTKGTLHHSQATATAQPHQGPSQTIPTPSKQARNQESQQASKQPIKPSSSQWPAAKGEAIQIIEYLVRFRGEQTEARYNVVIT